MTESNLNQETLTPIQIEIPVSNEPFETALAVEKAIYSMAVNAGYQFVYRLVRNLPSRHYELGLVKIDKELKDIDVHIYKDELIIRINDKSIILFTTDLNVIYETLWQIAEELGYGSAIPVNDSPDGEGVILYGFGRELQIWRCDEKINDVYEPKKVIVKIGVSEI